MKKIILIIIACYLLVIGIAFYFVFGPGVITAYEPLTWKGIETMVPADSNVQTYQSKGWDVYFLKKSTAIIKVAVKPAVDVSGLPRYSKRLLYDISTGPGEMFYIANPLKNIEVVYAHTMEDKTAGDMTVYFSVTSPSFFSSRFIMEKMIEQCFYKGEKVAMSTSFMYSSIPSRCYLSDYLFLGTMALSLIIVLFLIGLSGQKPSEKYFIGDPIYCDERNIYYSKIRRFRRQNNFCYLALTAAGRLMIFSFKRPAMVIDIRQEKPNLRIEGNKIILQKEKEKFVFRSAKIHKWQDALKLFSY